MLRILLILSLSLPLVWADSPATALTTQQKIEFLQKAKVIKVRAAPKGVTGSTRATLSDGVVTHDAHIQKVDEEKARFEGNNGLEIGFRDTYKFNIAGYRLAVLLGLGDKVPPSVERLFEGSKASYTWWVDDVQMDETGRVKNKAECPDHQFWARQYQLMKIFDQLIYNTDRNQQNILYDKDWKLWMIDHTRAFRVRTDLQNPKALDTCDRILLEHMKSLTAVTVKEACGEYLRTTEIKGLLARRDKIVAHFEHRPEKTYDFLTK